MCPLQYEWDESKSERNREQRGFDFEDAIRVFDGHLVEWCDIRQAWGEVRTVAVGAIGSLILAVVYTERDQKRRIISARVARKKEADLWRWSARPWPK